MPIWLRYAVFGLLVFGLLGGANAYVFVRARSLVGRTYRWLLLVPFVIAPFAILAGRLSRDAALGEPLMMIGAGVELAAVIAAGCLAPLDLSGRLAGLVHVRWRARRRLPWHPRLEGRRAAGGSNRAGDPEPGLEAAAVTAAAPSTIAAAPSTIATAPPTIAVTGRRAFLHQATTATALCAGAGTASYGTLFGRHDYQIEEIAVPIPGLSPHLDGFTIVQLSDLHIGTFVGEAELRAAVALVGRARPDLVVMTGDLLDHDIRHADALGSLARRLGETSRHGVFAVVGNHDYYAGVEVVVATLRRAGITVLDNAAKLVGDRGGAVALLGVDDLWASRSGAGEGPKLERALAMVPPDLPRILLCHNPAFFPEAAGDVALQLSGHTHGGQVNVGDPLTAMVLPYGYVAGFYRRSGSVLYVNRGFGTAGPPARLGSPPEVTRIVLTRA